MHIYHFFCNGILNPPMPHPPEVDFALATHDHSLNEMGDDEALPKASSEFSRLHFHLIKYLVQSTL
jgi:hypothetical protein